MAVSTRLEATAPWGWRSGGAGAGGIGFVLVLGGGGILTLKNDPVPVQLAAGDVFMRFDSEPYTMVDSAASAVVPCEEVERYRAGHVIRFGGGGVPTTLISGSFALDPRDAVPILAILPRFLHMRAEPGRSASFLAILNLLSTELDAADLASEATVTRLYELLFIHAVRAYARDGAAAGGWLAAVSDKQLGLAARAMHAELGRAWSLDALAARAHMSRSAFALKFKAVVGQTPVAYLTHWRMHRAGALIRKGDMALAAVAQSVGYASESAFNRAFKQAFGMTPGAYRRVASPPSA